MNETLIRTIFLLHMASTLFMLGVIVFVQVVHYPLFGRVGGAEFAGYERLNVRWTTWVVGPPMLVEAAGAALMMFGLRPSWVTGLQCGLGLGLLVMIWLSTLLVQVPCHDRLCKAFDAATHRRLVATNGLRTVAWGLRGGLVMWMLWSAWG